MQNNFKVGSFKIAFFLFLNASGKKLMHSEKSTLPLSNTINIFFLIKVIFLFLKKDHKMHLNKKDLKQ